MARLSDDEIDERLAGSDWRREGGVLVRDIELSGFEAAMALVNAVADAAETANHHPDILIHGYRHVRLTLMTHSEGAITDSDLALAATIDALAKG